MKKVITLVALVMLVISSKAQLLVHEPFNYTPDPILGLWTQSTATWLRINTGDSVLVTSGNLTYPGLPASAGNKVSFDANGSDYYRVVTGSPVTSGSVYYSFILNVSSLGGLATTGGYFTSLIQGGSTTSYGASIWTRLSSTAGKYNIGISTRSNSTVTWLSTNFDPGTPYFVVGAYDIISGTANDVARIWVNTSAIGGAEPAADATSVAGTDLTASGIDKVLLRQDAATTTPFIDFDELRVGTTWQSVTPSGVVPVITASTLTGFGNVCINTSAGPNSFTISGTNLTTANVTVAALPGFTYSTSAGGSYTTSLSLTQPGGTYSQEIFVRFDPTAVQSYNGNIAIAGGGVTVPVNVAATGAGVNTIATVSTGAATAITQTTATAEGTITTIGCSAITAYGIEYSTSTGFTPGTGTQVPSSNLSGGIFTSALAGLSANTPYYYRAYATNNGGTAYGPEQTFTTLAAAIPTLTAGTLADFGNVCISLGAGPNSFTITGTDLTNADVTVSALTGFSFSTSAGGPFTASLTIPQPGGAFSQEIFVLFTPSAVLSYNGNIVVDGGGAASINVAATGSGVNTTPTVTTGVASSLTTVSATAAGFISNTGCSSITGYGIEYSTTAGFVNGTGTQVPSSNLSSGNFSSNLTGLAPNTPYYYKAYATNDGGTAYGNEETFTTLALTPTLNATALAAFGNICINTTAGPNSFTINGSALAAGDVTVGPLAGFSFSTTAGGTYSTTLTITQPGGTFAQDIFVTFTPTAVQSYDGNLPVSGGGATAITVPASGSGINTAPAVVTGGSSAITAIAATAAGTISSSGCSAITVYGIEFSTVNGFANGTGTQVASSNISGGNYTSALTGLIPSTTYYYKAYATNAGGTTWGSQQSFVTATPSISATTLTAFGNVCLNTVAGPNSFTITGTNLTTANVTVAALAGYTYSTTSNGTYTSTLSFTQPGGAFSQQVFVRFTPTAVQSYNGNIAIAGGGATAVNVAASGAGVNTTASVTTGAATAVTQTTATVAGSITATGCSAVTTYGIEYSLTNNFTPGTGTQAGSSNLSAGSFSSALAGLIPSTTYYYRAYATNAGGTVYGNQLSFTTATPVLSATALTAFGTACINTSTNPNSFTITGVGLTNANVNVGPLTGYSFATTSGGTYSASLALTQPGGPYSQTVFVKFNPTAVQVYNGNIPVTGGGASGINVAASGTGVNTIATVSTGASGNLTNHSAVLAGSITDIGCSAVTAYGIEYSGISGFPGGIGTKVPSANLAGASFSSSLNGLVQGATYYYRAYATNNGGTAYGPVQSFTVPAIKQGFHLYPNPVVRGTSIRITADQLRPGFYALVFFDGSGKKVYQHNINIQVNFINQEFRIPGYLQTGIYRISLVDFEKVISEETIMIQ